MPILHSQFRGEARGPDGHATTVSPQAALCLGGPCLRVAVMLFQPMAQAVLAAGQQVPDPISGRAMLDTGASNTCIDESVAHQLGLPVVDTISIATPSGPSPPRNVYPVTIEVVGLPVPLQLQVPRAIGVELQGQGLIALIGRDALAACTLFYNGPMGQVTLAL